MPDKAQSSAAHTTREDRIYLHYRAVKRRWDWHKSSKSAFFMFLARHWQLPIREIKKIVDSKRGERSDA